MSHNTDLFAAGTTDLASGIQAETATCRGEKRKKTTRNIKWNPAKRAKVPQMNKKQENENFKQKCAELRATMEQRAQVQKINQGQELRTLQPQNAEIHSRHQRQAHKVQAEHSSNKTEQEDIEEVQNRKRMDQQKRRSQLTNSFDLLQQAEEMDSFETWLGSKYSQVFCPPSSGRTQQQEN